MPQNPRSQERSHENHYGGTLRHHPEHDENIEKNFTDDNEDYLPNSAEYNDTQETKFNAEDRLAHEHHDRPEKAKDARDYKPSNYSEGGHGRQMAKPNTQENADNKDYALNKDFNQGAKRKYEESTAKHIDETQLPEPE